jgi:hypothetical protein
VGIIIAGLIAFTLMFVISLDAPYRGEGAASFWVMRFVFGTLAVLFAFWLRSRLKELPSQRNVEPLTNDHCLVCDGMMTDYPRWHCEACGVIRYGD